MDDRYERLPVRPSSRPTVVQTRRRTWHVYNVVLSIYSCGVSIRTRIYTSVCSPFRTDGQNARSAPAPSAEPTWDWPTRCDRTFWKRRLCNSDSDGQDPLWYRRETLYAHVYILYTYYYGTRSSTKTRAHAALRSTVPPYTVGAAGPI